MRFIMDEFTIKSKTGKIVLFQLLKQKNGDFRIRRNTGKSSSIYTTLSDKTAAIYCFENLRQRFNEGGQIIQ